MRRASIVVTALAVVWMAFAPSAEAAIVRGIASILAGILQVPIRTLAGTFTGPPILGTVFGAANGLIQGVTMVASGTLDLAFSAVDLAKTYGPYVLPFLL